MTQTLTVAEIPTDLPNFSLGDYPVEPIALQIETAFAQSKGIEAPVVWRFAGHEFAVDAKQNRIELIAEEGRTCTEMILQASQAAQLIGEPITLCWENWDTQVSPEGIAQMTMLFGAELETSIQEARLFAKHLDQPVEVIAGGSTFTVYASTKVKEATIRLIFSSKRQALAQLIDRLPGAIQEGTSAVVLWLGELASHGSENTDLIELADVISTIALSNLNYSDGENAFIAAAIAHISESGNLPPGYIATAQAFGNRSPETAVEICQIVEVDANLSLLDAWREVFPATRAQPNYVRFTHNDQTYFTDYTGVLVVDIPMGANFSAAFYLAWLAVAEVETTVLFHWQGHKFTLNPSREIVLFAGPREPLAQLIHLALRCTENIFLPEERADADKQFILDVRGLQVNITQTSNAEDLRAWIFNQLCAGPCHSVTD